MNEATARIKVNRLLERAGWRFFPDGDRPANIRLEQGVSIKHTELDKLGNDFDETEKGFVDFLLLDSRGFPLIVLEAKSEEKQPLVGKEQARRYARTQSCRFVILSNGNLHYFWDLERGNPYIITSFPTPESVADYSRVNPNPQRLIDEHINDDYMVFSQRPNYTSEAAWKNQDERPGFVKSSNLRFLRPYHLRAVTLASASCERRQRPLSFRDGHRHRQDVDRGGRRQVVPSLRQRLPRAVPCGPPRT